MSTPDGKAETPDVEATSRARQDDLTQSVGTCLAATPANDKLPWWKRLLGRV